MGRSGEIGERVDAKGRQVTGRSELSRGTRSLLFAFAALTSVALAILYVQAERTDEYWAWTIRPPLTAAFLGAGYGAGLVAVLISLRSGERRQVRMGLQAIFVFVSLTTVATFLHLDRFHFDADGTALIAAWGWLVVYVVVPIWILILLVGPLRAGRTVETSPWPSAFSVILWAQLAVLAATGVILFVAPAAAEWLWPWELTALTGRAVAAWLLCAAALAYLVVRERGPAQLDVPLGAYATFAALVSISVLRFKDQVDWQSPAAYGFVVILAVMLATGIAGMVLARTMSPISTAHHTDHGRRKRG